MATVDTSKIHGQFGLPLFAELALAKLDRSTTTLPRLAPELVIEGRKWADVIAAENPKDKKFVLLDMPGLSRLLRDKGCPPLLQQDPEFMAVVTYHLHKMPPFHGGVKGLMTAIGNNSHQAACAKIQSAIVRYSFELDNGGNPLTITQAESFHLAGDFVSRHNLHNLVVHRSPRRLIQLAYPSTLGETTALIRQALLKDYTSTSFEQKLETLSLTAAQLLLDTSAVTLRERDASGTPLYDVHPETFGQVPWTHRLQALKVHHLLADIGIDSMQALEYGAMKLGIHDLFGIESHQVPPWYVTREGMWEKHWNDKPLIVWVVAKVVAGLKKSNPELFERDGERRGHLIPTRAVGLPWGSLLNELSSSCLKHSPIGLVDALKIFDPHLFGLGKKQALPCELVAIGCKTKDDLRARLAVSLFRSGLGTLCEENGAVFVKIQLSDFEKWATTCPPTFGKEWIESSRGNLRRFGVESVGGAITLLITDQPEVPAIAKTFGAHKVFHQLFRHLLSEADNQTTKIRIPGMDDGLPAYEVNKSMRENIRSRFVFLQKREPSEAELASYIDELLQLQGRKIRYV